MSDPLPPRTWAYKAWLLLRSPATEREPLRVFVATVRHPSRPWWAYDSVLTTGAGPSVDLAIEDLVHRVRSGIGWSWIRLHLSAKDELLLFGDMASHAAEVGARFGWLSDNVRAALPVGTQLSPIPGRPSFNNTLVKVPPNANGLTWATLEPAGPSDPHDSDRSVQKERRILLFGSPVPPEPP